LRTFGTIAVERDGVPLGGRATQRRRLALLALLAAAGSRGVRRDKLIAYLWPEGDAEQGRHSLSQTLYSLRQELGADAILAGVDEVRLNDILVPSDLREFENALAASELDRAVAEYQGPFLDGFFLSDSVEFERWLEAERERLASACRVAHESLARAATSARDHAAAARHWRRRAELDPLNSNVALELMRALAASGDHAGALRHERVGSRSTAAEAEAIPIHRSLRVVRT
jgi:DNA-binding SARP family transcriptional activator